MEICVSVGGTVQCLSWDPHGERLAVMFKGNFLSESFGN